MAGATPALRPHDLPGTPRPRQAPASSTEALDPTALDVWPLPTHRLRAPCAQPPLPTAPPLWVPGAADLPGPFLQGPPGLAHLQPPPQEAASEPASSQTVSCPAGSVHRAQPPREPPALIPSRGQPPRCPSVAPALEGSPDSVGAPEGQRGGQGGARRLGGRDALAGLHLAKQARPTRAPCARESPAYLAWRAA